MKLLRALLPATDTRKRVELRGAIQGVGFRPFAYRTAKRFNIRGWVLNSSDGVVIEAEGADLAVDHFLRALDHRTAAAGADRRDENYGLAALRGT